MSKIIIEDRYEPGENPKMRADRIISQTFTCCGKNLKKFLWEGWDWIDGNILDSELIKDFKYCPYYGEKLDDE